jgi:hypothetical protein
MAAKSTLRVALATSRLLAVPMRCGSVTAVSRCSRSEMPDEESAWPVRNVSTAEGMLPARAAGDEGMHRHVTRLTAASRGVLQSMQSRWKMELQ